MSEYLKIHHIKTFPRILLQGSLDLTYRCNYNCRHCWICLPASSTEKHKELTFEQIKAIIDEARSMGCRKWAISGGEPMLRPDFTEIFDYITSKSTAYHINTNGSMITPEIAKLLKRKGAKMVALYGATPEVCDHITRHPGSFEATIRGLRYLKEAGARFVVQIIPMRDNYHQLDDMIRLAESFTPIYRIGSAWLYLSNSGDPERNQEIMRQRLDPKDVVFLDKPDLEENGQLSVVSGQKESGQKATDHCSLTTDHLTFASCIKIRREFHVDPYGKASFCTFLTDPEFRYDLLKGSVKECWETFIPSLADRIIGTEEYKQNCGSCELRKDCPWCPVYARMEHGRFSAKIEYLCDIAKEKRKFKENWEKNHRRYYQIAGITVRVESDIPITDTTFSSVFDKFQINYPGDDIIHISHHFSIPYLNGYDLGKELYRKSPWAIYKKGNSWIYLGITVNKNDPVWQVVIFNHDYSRCKIYHDGTHFFLRDKHTSLTLFPTDQILLAQVLAYRQGCYIHSSGVNLNNNGFLFVGHSGAGKSTMAKMLKDKIEILCDDRMIVRRWAEGFKIHGTWSHGEIPEVSAGSAPLKAVMFLEQSTDNVLIPIKDRKEILKRLISCLIKPLETAMWWDKMLLLLDTLSREVPCYILRFDKSGKAVDLVEKLQ